MGFPTPVTLRSSILARFVPSTAILLAACGGGKEPGHAPPAPPPSASHTSPPASTVATPPPPAASSDKPAEKPVPKPVELRRPDGTLDQAALDGAFAGKEKVEGKAAAEIAKALGLEKLEGAEDGVVLTLERHNVDADGDEERFVFGKAGTHHGEAFVVALDPQKGGALAVVFTLRDPVESAATLGVVTVSHSFKEIHAKGYSDLVWRWQSEIQGPDGANPTTTKDRIVAFDQGKGELLLDHKRNPDGKAGEPLLLSLPEAPVTEIALSRGGKTMKKLKWSKEKRRYQ